MCTRMSAIFLDRNCKNEFAVGESGFPFCGAAVHMGWTLPHVRNFAILRIGLSISSRHFIVIARKGIGRRGWNDVAFRIFFHSVIPGLEWFPETIPRRVVAGVGLIGRQNRFRRPTFLETFPTSVLGGLDDTCNEPVRRTSLCDVLPGT